MDLCRMKRPWNDIRLILLLCATLGLAPFVPEPHVWDKLRWVAGGAVGMPAIAWFDLAMHGAPWVLLIQWGVRRALGRVPQ